MKMKLKLLLLALWCVMANANDTTDRLCLSINNELSDPIKLNTSSDASFLTVSLQGSDISYTGYELYIHLPDGMTPMMEDGKPIIYMAADDMSFDGKDIYPYTTNRITKKKTYTHTISASLQAGNVICVICYSSESQDLTDFSGDLFHIMIEGASAYMKPGDVEIPITGVLTHNDWDEEKEMLMATSYYPSMPCGGMVTVSCECSNVPFNVSSSAHWSTCVLPFDAELPDGVTALTSDNYDEENIYLTKAESIKAYTPYVLYSEEGYNGTVSGTVDPEKYPEDGYVQNGLLCGAIVPQKVTEGFVLQNLQDGVKFYGIGSGSTFNIPAGKCWMSLPASNAKALNFVISDVTGITALNTTTANDGVIYNLQGMKVTTPVAGNIYIRNGKKFAINK